MKLITTKNTIFDINTTSLFDPNLFTLGEEANQHLGQLNQLSLKLSEYSFIIDVLRNIEALTSAKIEGTTGNLEDLYNQADLSFDKKVQLKLFSAINYKNTITSLEEIVSSQKVLDLRLMRHLHKLLTENDPSTVGTPGKFRTAEVKIRNSKLGDFYPPNAIEVPSLMQLFIDEEFTFPRRSLFNVAVKHYQFEATHPFEDGNGRTGRLLIITQFLQQNLLKHPILNLSSYFDKNRDDYIYSLRTVSDKRDYKPWVELFFKAVIQQSIEVEKLIESLKKLRDRENALLRQNIKGTNAPFAILDFALDNFYFTLQDLEKYLKLKKLPLKDYYQTARKNVHRLEKLELIKKSHRRSQADVYVHFGLQQILMGDFSSGLRK